MSSKSKAKGKGKASSSTTSSSSSSGGGGKKSVEFEGLFTAIITPMTEGKGGKVEVDYPALEALVESQIAGGVHGIVPVGTTGESPTLSTDEKKKVIETCVKKAKGRIKVIAGTGSNNTSAAAEMTAWAKSSGIDAALAVIPYYNKPSQEGMYQHFKEITKQAPGMPLVLYNIPGRCGVKLDPATIARLYHDLDEVVAVKESTGSLDIATEIASLCDITILSGDDSLTLPLMSIGGKGVISVLSNWAPELVGNIVNPALKGDYKSAGIAHRKAFSLMKTMFTQPNPQPVKCAMSMLGMCDDVLRLPMITCDEATRGVIAETMKGYGYKVNLKKRKRGQ